MNIIKPNIKFSWMTDKPLQAIELAGRTCYKSEDKITETSATNFVKKLLKSGHHAMIEHASASFRGGVQPQNLLYLSRYTFWVLV